MVAVDSNHDTDPKQLLIYPGVAGGGLLPAGQTAAQDLKGALDNVFNHPNVGPFVCRELIQHLVTSNPSPAYIQRVTSVFNDNGSGVRGDMKSVITAILMDQEARRGDDPATAVGTDGHLQEPILFITGLMRAFNATSDGSNLSYYSSDMGQEPLFSPSVFNFYSPNYVIPGTASFGPEFQLLTTATSLNRVNWVNTSCVWLDGFRKQAGFFKLRDTRSESRRTGGHIEWIADAWRDVFGHEKQHRDRHAKRARGKQAIDARSANRNLSDREFFAVPGAALNLQRAARPRER